MKKCISTIRLAMMFAICMVFTPAPAAAQGVSMELHPFEIPSLGMTVRLPEGSVIDIRRIAGSESLVVITDPDNPHWSIRFQNYIARDPDMSPPRILDEIIKSRQARWKARDADQPNLELTRLRFFQRNDRLLIGGTRQASRVYTDVPADPKLETVGYTVIRHDAIAVDPDQPRVGGMPQFVVCEMHAIPEGIDTSNIQKTMQLYETVLATITFRDPAEMKAERYAAINMGQAFLDSLNIDDLTLELDEDARFFRIYRPAEASDGSSEVGWKRLEVRKGRRGELEPDRPRKLWREADLEDGFIAREEARVVIEGTTFDTRGIYFLSDDRESEVWSIVNVAERDGRKDSSTLTLVRDEHGITVTTAVRGQMPDEKKYRTLPEGYLSRVELYLLPRLVVNRRIPGLYGFYTYDPILQSLTYREESFSNEGGVWIQETIPTANTASMKTTIDRQGHIVSKDMGSGAWMEPSSADEIKRIWKRIEAGNR